MNNTKTKNIVAIGLMAALICIAGPIAVPLPFTPVPISLTNFAIYIACGIVGTKKGTMSTIVFLLLGAVGLPVFAGFSGGVSKLAGPTGGYLIGFIFCAVITGLFADMFENKIYMYPVGMVIGTAITYLFGTVWLSMQLHLSFTQGLMMGVIPYLPGDTIKIILATLIAYEVRTRIKKTQILAA